MKFFNHWVGVLGLGLLLGPPRILALDINTSGCITELDSFLRPEKSLGMIGVSCREGRYYWQIPDSLFMRDLLLVCRIEAAAAGNRSRNDGYAGDQVNTAVYRFEKKSNKQLYLRKMILGERADSANVIFPAYRKSNVQSIAMTFDIKVSESAGTVIDVTDWLQSDTDLLYFSAASKGALRLGGSQKDKSEVLSVRTYDRNVEIRVQKTYALQGGLGNATYLLHSSLLLLPETAMIPRFYDERIGYFTTDYQDFDADPYELQRTQVIQRWRLEPSGQDRERYFQGEMVEPVKPIVFYIDPVVPAKWVKYMIQGVNDWQPVFEKAGFKNAIYAREAPSVQEDSEWSPEDGRYSVIDYKASGVANAFGKLVCDPRSGEIIQGRIHFHHSLLHLLQAWYFVQCSPLDTLARSLPLSEERMGRMIRMIISHEVGHAIGLTHNFGGTSGFSVEQLRDPDFLKAWGHTTSIMDYSRLNYVVQPEDHIDPELLFPRIGVYDAWAVEWGYRLYPGIKNAWQEMALLTREVERKNQDSCLWFGGEDSPADPRCQAEDLGNNPMLANQLGIANLQIVMKHLKAWTGGSEENRAQLYQEIFYQYRRYLGHVLKWIGGVYDAPSGGKVGDGVRKPVEKVKQQEAVEFIARHFLSVSPGWLFPAEILACIPERQNISMEMLCNQVFEGLLNKQTLTRLSVSEKDINGYQIGEFFADLDRIVWKKRNGRDPSDQYRRLIEKTYVATLCRLYRDRDLKSNSDLNAVLFAQLKHLQEITGKKRHSGDDLQLVHRRYMQAMITKTLGND